jgi:hypothetical protein
LVGLVLADQGAADDDDNDAPTRSVIDEHPEWQKEHRQRTSSVAQEAADMTNFKAAVRTRGSSVAIEASRTAVFQGVAVHD